MPTAADIFDSFGLEAEGSELFLELAEADQENLWGEGDVRYQWAIALRAAHMMESGGLITSSSSSAGPTGGAVTSEHIGSLSVSYAQPTSSAGGVSGTLDNTRWGRLLQELLAGAIVPMMTIDGCGLYGFDGGHAIGPFEYSRTRWLRNRW